MSNFSLGYGTLLPVFPILVAAPQYIAGAMSLGVLMQAGQAFQRLTSALSWPVDSIGDIARCRASAGRVLSLHEELRRLDTQAREAGVPSVTVEQSQHGRLLVEDLCIAEPSGLLLLERFSADIRRGERVLVTGDPAATSSFFKVIAGLWPWGSGRIVLPGDGTMMFVPQRPFLPEGSLRGALCYPHAPESFEDAAVRHALECAGLVWRAPRLDECDNWEQALPLRVQQRLGFARVLLHRPAWVFTEEATNAFDPHGEHLILGALHRELPDAKLLTISSHQGLDQLHHRQLVLTRLRETRYLFDGRRGNNHAH